MPQNFAKSPPYFWLALHRKNIRWRFCKIFWPSQNIWTLLKCNNGKTWKIRQFGHSDSNYLFSKYRPNFCQLSIIPFQISKFPLELSILRKQSTWFETSQPIHIASILRAYTMHSCVACALTMPCFRAAAHYGSRFFRMVQKHQNLQ